MRLAAFTVAAMLGSVVSATDNDWRELPALPQALGGQFVGTVGGLLVVAGGTYWERAPWEGGVKQWTDAIQVFDGRTWSQAGKLPFPLAYGASVPLRAGLALFGGQRTDDLSDQVLLLSGSKQRIVVRELGRLPHPMAMMSAAALGDTVYLAGGQPTFAPTRALRTLIAATVPQLLKGNPQWTEHPAWDGPPRFFAQVAADSRSLYLAGGSDLKPGAVREFLSDAHQYTPGKGWSRLADLPRAAQAGVAAIYGDAFCVIGGSDGSLSEDLRERHPGFRREVLCYRSGDRQWEHRGTVPASLVTTGIARWRNELVIAGGEDRPGHRSARVVGLRRRSKP